MFCAGRLAVGLLAVAWSGGAIRAADGHPVVGPGATREEALSAYGWPTGQSQSGNREILTYPQGRILLENGRVDRVDFATNVAWPAPRPRPAGPTARAGKKSTPVTDRWVTDFAAASAEAQARHARVLAVFTGSDWSPGSRQFDDEVAADPEFISSFEIEYVFLRVDFRNRKPLPDAVRAQNTILRERYGVTTYPTMLVLSPAGDVLAKVDLENLPGDGSYRARILAALREVADTLAAKPTAPDPLAPPARVSGQSKPAPAAHSVAASGVSAGTAELGATLSSATWLLGLSLAGGAVLVGVALWWLWRSGPASRSGGSPPPKLSAEMPRTTLPPVSAATDWSKEQLCLVTAKLIEAEGFKVAARPAGSDADLTVSRPGAVSARALVVCVPAQAGRVPTKRVRELLAAVTLEGASEGWLVAPGGFVPEARAFAVGKGIAAIDATAFTERLEALPPLARSRMLGAAS